MKRNPVRRWIRITVSKGWACARASGSRRVIAGYFEFRLPVMSALSFDVSGRYDHYSDFGDAFTPKASFGLYAPEPSDPSRRLLAWISGTVDCREWLERRRELYSGNACEWESFSGYFLCPDSSQCSVLLAVLCSVLDFRESKHQTREIGRLYIWRRTATLAAFLRLGGFVCDQEKGRHRGAEYRAGTVGLPQWRAGSTRIHGSADNPDRHSRPPCRGRLS